MKISIILPVYSENASLVAAIEEINTVVSPGYIHEIIIIASPRSSKESLATCKRVSQQYPFIHYILQQNNPGVGWAFREALGKVTGTHVLMMASDGDTDPAAIPKMIKKAEETDCDIVLANRWSGGGGFERYDPMKKILNYLFQKIMKVLFVPTIDDYTYGFRLYKTGALNGCTWEETRHPFFLESLLKPMKSGFNKIEQIPVKQTSRTAGASKNTFFQNFLYLRTAIKVYLEK